MNQPRLHRDRSQYSFAARLGVLLSALLLLCACERRELTYYTESEISIAVDWSRAGLEAEKDYGATLIVYPHSGSAPYVVLMGERESATVRLPPGMYDAVVFNRSFDDFAALAFRGHETLETFEAYARKVETRSQTRVIVSSPERLAAATLTGFEVTEDMLGNYAPAASRATDCPQGKCRLALTPLPLTQQVNVKLNAKGLNNVRQARCTLQGVSLSIFMRDGQPGSQTGGQEFSLSDPEFLPGSISEGWLMGTINTFNLQEGTDYGLDIKALLVDGKTVVEQTAGKATVRRETDGDGNIVIYLEVDAPEPFPYVPPEGGTDSGFDAEVGDWEKEENTDIDI